MELSPHVYQIDIAATPDQVWLAITDSEWTRQYFHTTSFVEPPAVGRPYRTVMADGHPAIEGDVREMSPPRDGQPGRFVVTWRVLYDATMSAEPPSRVEWTVEPVEDCLTRVRLVHGDLTKSPLTWAGVKDGWVEILEAMKALVEAQASERPASAAAGSARSSG